MYVLHVVLSNTTCNTTYNLYVIIHVLYKRMCTKGSASSLNQGRD